jgi:predicted O-methyltransferase YrrM
MLPLMTSDVFRPLGWISKCSPPAAVPASLADLVVTPFYTDAVSYFAEYPARSLMSHYSRSVLYCLIRMLRPQAVAEVGTLFAGTTEVMARALWENGAGMIYTADPYGADRCPDIIASWPQELRCITHFRPLSSMDFFLELDRQRVALDLVLVDGNHDFEFALFDLQMAARLLRPGGVVVMDNAEQTGPFQAARSFIANQPGWRELGSSIAHYDPRRPFDRERTSLPGTTFVVLQAPPHLSIGTGPHSWGQKAAAAPFAGGLSLELLPQVTAGTLHYQALLRGFADGNRYVAELRTEGAVRLALDGPAKTLAHRFSEPLALVVPAQHGDASFTFEVDLAWQPDAGSPPLALAAIPSPLCN